MCIPYGSSASHRVCLRHCRNLPLVAIAEVFPRAAPEASPSQPTSAPTALLFGVAGEMLRQPPPRYWLFRSDALEDDGTGQRGPLALNICSRFHMRLALSLGPTHWLSSALSHVPMNGGKVGWGRDVQCCCAAVNLGFQGPRNEITEESSRPGIIISRRHCFESIRRRPRC